MTPKDQGRRIKSRNFDRKKSKNGEKWRKEGPNKNGPNPEWINDQKKLENGKLKKNVHFG
jgi:hypothetical protein